MDAVRSQTVGDSHSLRTAVSDSMESRLRTALDLLQRFVLLLGH